MKYVDLGKVVVKHVSGMAETDKGNRFPSSANVGKGDQLIEIDGVKRFVDADEFKELEAVRIKAEKSEKSAKAKVAKDAKAAKAKEEADAKVAGTTPDVGGGDNA